MTAKRTSFTIALLISFTLLGFLPGSQVVLSGEEEGRVQDAGLNAAAHAKADDPGYDFGWARQLNVNGGARGFRYGIAVDGAGNVYTIGEFLGTSDFDPGPGTATLTASDRDLFVWKLDANGDFVWAQMLDSDGEAEAPHITVDDSGNVYATGRFAGPTDFDPGPGTFILDATGQDIFVWKLDTDGNFVWARQAGDSAWIITRGIAVDASGNVYTGGGFEDTVDFDPGPGVSSFTSAGWQDIFVLKLDANGDFVWARRLGGPSLDSAAAIAVDASANVFVAGEFNGTSDFDPGPGTFELTAEGFLMDLFVVKLDANGDFAWARKSAHATDPEPGAMVEPDSSVEAIAVDASQNVVAAGHFTLPLDFDPGPETSTLTSPEDSAAYVWKLDANGDFVWAGQLAGSGGVSPHGIAMDVLGNVYTTGSFSGTVDFDPGPDTFELTANGGDIFVAKLDADGELVWARQLGGSGSDRGMNIVVDASDDVFVAGVFEETADFDPGPGTFELAADGVEVFVWKLHDNDLDGLTNTEEIALGTGIDDPDTDDDGLPDGLEVDNGSDPLVADADGDLDEDGMTDLEELEAGTDAADPNDPPDDVYVDALNGDDETGDGTQENAWQTISMAMSDVARYAHLHPVTINAATGTYAELVQFVENVTLKGAGSNRTAIEFFDPDAPTSPVVAAAPQTALSDCIVTLPIGVSGNPLLLRIEDVVMEVHNVVFDGTIGIGLTTAVFVTGEGSSGSVIRRCELVNLERGIHVVDSRVNVTQNLFDNIRRDAVFIGFTTKQTAGVAPLLGDESDITSTGFNRFRDVDDNFIKYDNVNPALTFAQFNDWGVFTEEEIRVRLSVPTKDGTDQIIITPFIGRALVPGSIVVELLDGSSGDAIPETANPIMQLGGSDADRDAPSSLWISQDLVPGTYNLLGRADGYADATATATLLGTEIVPVSMELQYVGSEGAGDSEGEGGDGGCAATTAAFPGTRGMPGDLLLLALLTSGLLVVGRRRRRMS